MPPVPPEFDSRGNRLRAYEFREDPLRLLLCADNATYQHVRRFLAQEGIVPGRCGFPESEIDRWTHCLTLPRVPDELPAFLNLLTAVLVLRNLPVSIDDVIALDFYKIPREGIDPDDWPDTTVGELVNKMKYWTSDPVAQAHARAELAKRMAMAIQRHPQYHAARLATTPGHRPTEPSPSELLAGEVAKLLGVGLVRTQARSVFRPQMKGRADRVSFKDEFDMDRALVASRPILILDDVLGRGTTMEGVALAARRAGAPFVHGLVGARTIR